MSSRRLLILAACLLTTGTAAQTCPAREAPAATQLAPRVAAPAPLVAWKPRAWRPAGLAAASLGLRVALDPETGLPGSASPETFEALSRLEPDDERPVSLLTRGDGSRRAQLDERWASHAVVSLDANRRPRWTCVHGSRAADQFMKHPIVPSRAPAPGTVWEEK
jgi:hypothetical protein